MSILTPGLKHFLGPKWWIYASALGIGAVTRDSAGMVATMTEWLMFTLVEYGASLFRWLWKTGICGFGGPGKTPGGATGLSAEQSVERLLVVLRDGQAWIDGVIDVSAVVYTAVCCVSAYFAVLVAFGCFIWIVSLLYDALVQNSDVNPIP